MSEKKNNKIGLALVFLAGVIVTALVAYAWLGRQNIPAQKADSVPQESASTQADTASGKEGKGFFVVCDDTQREYGSDEKAGEYYSEVEKNDWTAFSMADDWKTIYGDDVHKTELPGAEN